MFSFRNVTVASYFVFACESACATPAAVLHDASQPIDATVGSDATDHTVSDTAVTQVFDASCPTAMPDASAVGPRCVRAVHGRVTDVLGAPLSALVVTVCGIQCYIGITATDGTFEVLIGTEIDPDIYFVEAHGRPDYATLYTLVPHAATPSGDITLASDLVLPKYDPPGTFFPDAGGVGDLTADGITLSIPPNAEIQPTFDDAVLGDIGARFRVAPVDMNHAPSFVREASLSAAWALAPQELTSSVPLGLRVPNTPNFPPTAAVDFVAMGTSILVAPLNAGSPVVVASGHVSSDGQSVSTDIGQGLSTISWIGIRLHTTSQSDQ